MSYCVECGVKLEQSLKSCPLCHTPVINPNEFHKNDLSGVLEPFASVKGEVDPFNRHDMGLWFSLVYGSTALACGILNIFVFDHNFWSIPVIGACIILWIFFCPRMFCPKIPFWLNFIAGGISVIFYQLAITLMTKSDRWFYELALPITIFTMLLIGLFALLYKLASKSLIASALYLFIDVGILSVFIEFIVDRFIKREIHIFWSAIVFSVCAVISVALIATLSMKRLRENVRKRFHF